MIFTNSPLATYTLISPNRTINRNHAIDTITIHCFVGQVTAKRGCEVFQPTSRSASCNYVVGHDGSIGLCVEEKDRSWCTGGVDKNNQPIRVNGISGGANDYQAVTIEVASDATAPYAITDKAMTALVELCADICKRNGIPKLLWQGDKKLVGNIAKQNMTVHRWFANKACPGDYLYDRMGEIAAKVNAKLGAVDAPQIGVGMGLVGITNEEKIWNYLMGKIGNAYGVAGMMGNLEKESGLKPTNLENSCEAKLKAAGKTYCTDEAYTAAVDSGQIARSEFLYPLPGKQYGYGLAQWTSAGRKAGLYDLVKSRGVSIGDLETQLIYLDQELNGAYKAVLNVLKAAKSVKEASDAVLTKFERPADQSEDNKKRRAVVGQSYYDRFAGKPAPSGTVYKGVDYAPVFDAAYYAAKWDDVRKVCGNNAAELFGHFVTFGMQEGRQAKESFNVYAYWSRHEDLRKAFGDDLASYYRHYVLYGAAEGRIAT